MNQWELDQLLIASAIKGQIHDVKQAIQQGANVDAQGLINDTALLKASERGYIHIVRYLLQAKANPNLANMTGSTPLIKAAIYDHLDIILLLLKHGVNIHHADQFGKTALHHSSQEDHKGVVEVLLRYQANINAVDYYGWTALHFAASCNHREIIKMLITNGADITVVNKDGMTPAEVAQTRGYRNIAKLIIDEALQRIFKRGIHKGNVQLTNMRLVLMGPPCVGKTSFKSLLFNWSAPKFHNSTALATRPIRALERVAGRNEGNIWEKVTSLDLLRMLSDAIHALEQDSQQETNATISEDASGTTLSTESPEEITTSTSTIELTDQSHSATLLLPTAIKSTISERDSKVLDSATFTTINPAQTSKETKDLTIFPISSRNTTVSSDKSASPVVSSTSPAKEVSSIITNEDSDQYSRKLSEILAEQKMPQNRHKATWINILDSGGQPQFADVSRAFIRGNTINIICTKLTESLFEKPRFFYSLNGKCLNQPGELQMNNLQVIEHFVRSVVSSKDAIVVKGRTRLPLFMIIGTYYDKTKGAKKGLYEPLQYKNKQLLSTLGEFHDHFIFHNDDQKELIFPVDNLCWWNRKKISSSLRQHIMSYEKDIAIASPIPVRWYMFELRLKTEVSQEEHGMISLESCCSIGVSLGMDVNDVLKSLSHLHTMALFLYFPNVLHKVLFTNPQYLLDMISALIRVSFVDSLKDILLEGKSITPDSQREFCEFGVFDECLLDSVCLPFVSSLLTKKDFLKLLRYLRIVTPLSTTDGVKRYFMPVVLPPNQAKGKDILLFQKKCDPMIITFRSKSVPQGVFPAVVVALVDRTESPHFSLDSCSIAFPRQLRYAVLLYSEDLFGSVLIVDQFYWIEVYYNGMTENCFKLRNVICEAISTCADILAYDEEVLKAEVTVPCKQAHREYGHKLHPVIISWDHKPPLMRCSIEKQLPTLQLIDKRQTCWLINPSSVTSTCKSSKSAHKMSIVASERLVTDPVIVPVSSNLPDGPLNESHLVALIRFAKEIEDWEMLGVYLGIKNAVLKEIKKNNHYQSGPARKDMLMTWLDKGKATRKKFIEALKDMDHLRIVQEIESQNDTTSATPQFVRKIHLQRKVKDTESKPEKLQLMRLLSPIAYKWKEIGEALEVKHGALMSLHMSHFSDEQKLSNVLQLWIDGQPTNVKWSNIIRAVESPPVDNLSTAENIRCFLSKLND